MLKLLKNK